MPRDPVALAASAKSVAIRQAGFDVVEDLIDRCAAETLEQVRRKPWLDGLDLVAVWVQRVPLPMSMPTSRNHFASCHGGAILTLVESSLISDTTFRLARPLAITSEDPSEHAGARMMAPMREA